MISERTTKTTRGVDKVTTEITRGVNKAIVIAVSVASVLVVCGVVLIVVLFWLRKRRAGNGKQKCDSIFIYYTHSSQHKNYFISYKSLLIL
jgi:hypothetical protein